MNQKILLLLAFALITIIPAEAISQEFTQPVKPDYKWIEKVSQDPVSPYNYHKLMDRYKANDTALADTDFRVLYYGSFFQPEFSAFGVSSYNDSIKVLILQDSLRMEDFPKLIRYETYILEEFPFSPRDLNTIGYAFERLGDTANAIMAAFKLHMVVKTILSSGDGKSEETGWHVISTGHEYDLINLLGFQFGGEQSVTEKVCDFLTVQPNQYGIEGFFFDVRELMNAENRALDRRLENQDANGHQHKHEHE